MIRKVRNKENIKHHALRLGLHVDKAVICIETQQIFNSPAEAAQSLGISNEHIGDVCNKKRNITGGYHWAWLNDTQQQKELKDFIGLGKSSASNEEKSVICIETQMLFSSVTQAERWCKSPKVGEVCNGNRNIAGGYHWAWESDIEKQNILKEYIGKPPITKSVICVETGQFFKNVTEARKIGGHHVGDVCNGKRNIAGGYHWRWATLEEINQQNK